MSELRPPPPPPPLPPIPPIQAPRRPTVPPPSGRRGLVVAVLAIIAALIVGSCAGTLLYARDQLGAPSDTHGAPVAFTVSAGEDVDAVASDLDSKGLVRSAFWFTQLARLRNLGSNLHVGTFMLDDGMAAGTIISVLSGDATAAPRRVQLTEGMTADQMATRIDAARLGISHDAYLDEVHHGTFTAPFLAGRPAGASLEGFLFPDTYDVPDGATPHQFVQMQLDDFGRRATNVLALPPGDGYHALTLASIIEREARDDADRPLVASVIHNRLAQGIDLQVDASVLYGLHLLGRDGTTVDVKTDTPYNTYLHPGLPPTPISNPGVKSLEAAAHPPASDYLYYVSDGCGHNHYSASLAEHNRQITQFVGKPCATAGASPSP